MNEDDMAEVVAGHVLTARHLREAGLDGLEVHFGHGHLLQQFLSPASNMRTDAYGGSEENRLRFPLQVLRAVREVMGPDYPVGIRISAEEFMSPGLTLEDMQRTARDSGSQNGVVPRHDCESGVDPDPRPPQ